MSKHDRAINSFRLALGTSAYCKTCAALLRFGVNSVEAMNEVAKITGRPTFGANWEKLLANHAKYHEEKGEVIPEAFLASALTEEFKKSILPQPRAERPVVAKPRAKREPYIPYAERAALAYFLSLGGTVAENGKDNKPVIAKTDTTAFAGFKD